MMLTRAKDINDKVLFPERAIKASQQLIIMMITQLQLGTQSSSTLPLLSVSADVPVASSTFYTDHIY